MMTNRHMLETADGQGNGGLLFTVCKNQGYFPAHGQADQLNDPAAVMYVCVQ